MKRAGFTMIELIFVIVILGILAAVAIPKLAATRNDASSATYVTNLATCINDAGAAYLKDGNFTTTSAACASADDCFDFNTTDSEGTLTVTADSNASKPSGCTDAVTDANNTGLITTHTF